MHMSPSAKASRVGLPAKSSVLSSKLVAGWKHRVLTSGHILGNKTFNRFFEKLSISFLSNVTCWVAIFFSRHPVASCDSEIAVFGLIWFGLTNDRPKLILLLSYTFGSVTFLRHNSQFLAVDICTGFHRCNTFQLWHCVILQHNFILCYFTTQFHLIISSVYFASLHWDVFCLAELVCKIHWISHENKSSGKWWLHQEELEQSNRALPN